MIKPLLFPIPVLFLFAGCAVTPLQPLPASHPASPQAVEAAIRPASTSLSPDDATRTTRQLLNGTDTASPDEKMPAMPGMNH